MTPFAQRPGGQHFTAGDPRTIQAPTSPVGTDFVGPGWQIDGSGLIRPAQPPRTQLVRAPEYVFTNTLSTILPNIPLASVEVSRELVYRGLHLFYSVQNLTAYWAQLRVEFLDAGRLIDAWRFTFCSNDGSPSPAFPFFTGMRPPFVIKRTPAATVTLADDIPWPAGDANALHWLVDYDRPAGTWQHWQIVTWPMKAAIAASTIRVMHDVKPQAGGAGNEIEMLGLAVHSSNLPL